MGCTESVSAYKRVYIMDENVPGQGKMASDTFARLGLDADAIQKFYNKFCEIDKDESNEIDLDEFYRYFRLPRTPFADRVFSIMDEDGSGEIDFREFVSCVWNYCTFDLKALVKFAFSLFDLDGSGVLEASEVRTLVEEVYGDGYKSNVRVQRIVDKIDSNADGEINFDEFNNFNRQYPALLFPAFSMQMTLRERIFGISYWNSQTELRRMRGGGRTQSIFEILADMDESEYKRKLDDLMADTAGGKWQPPSLADQVKSGKSKKKKKSKKKGISVSVAESKEAKEQPHHRSGRGAKGEKAAAAAAAENSALFASKRKPRRRRGGS